MNQKVRRVFFIVIAFSFANTAEILVHPMSMRVNLGRTDPVVFNCTIAGSSLLWYFNDTLFDFRSSTIFERRGISSSKDFISGIGSGTARVTAMTGLNNNTVVRCSGTSITSNNASLFIADVPQTPSPYFMALNESLVQVWWDAPFSWQDFPITNYNVEVRNETGAILASSELDQDSLSFNLTRMGPPPSCTNLTFSVEARSSVGLSEAGIVHGAFPVGPGEFLEPPRHEVTFTRSLLPILEVNITLPSLCPFSNATYIIEVTNAVGEVVYTLQPPSQLHWRESGTHITAEIREGLQSNSHYTANVSVTTLAGQTFTAFEFNTTSIGTSTEVSISETNTDSSATVTGPTLSVEGVTKDTGTQLLEIVGISLGIVVVLAVLGILVAFGVCAYGRSIKRKKERARVGGVKSMVNNPIYESGAIYEEIPDHHSNSKSLGSFNHEKEDGYVSISATLNSNANHPACGPQGGLAGEEAYTLMNSVTLLGKLKDNEDATTADEKTEHYVVLN